jgi:hypothetical protein
VSRVIELIRSLKECSNGDASTPGSLTPSLRANNKRGLMRRIPIDFAHHVLILNQSAGVESK